ncbi:MAG: prolyl aminopeptidase [Hyphomicrobium sp.]|nr:prolyl aminopeptidase [Hyphomicrobium sp.]
MPDQAMIEEPLRPFDARMLAVGDGHWLYVEEVGRRDGTPALFLHGGPGSGAQHAHRRLFDPSRFHALLFDQRGAGRSHPYLSLTANTTQRLIADIEAIREHFGIERWLVVGGSWGSTLAIAYAEAFPERVSGLVMRAIFLGTHEEVEWAFVEGPKLFRPDLFAEFIALLPEDERSDPLTAYLRRLADPDPAEQAPVAQAWAAYERALSELAPAQTRLTAPVGQSARLPPTPIVEGHYIRNDFFLEPDQLLRDAHRLHGIPGVIVQGRYDLLCPPKSAYALSQAWGNCRLQLIDKAGHAMTEPGVTEALVAAISEVGERR